MKKGTCVKCGSTNVYHKSNGINYVPRAIGTLFETGGGMPAPVEDYICIDCGYFEHYLLDERKREEIAKNWEKTQ